MKLFEIANGHNWRESFHATNVNLKEITHLQASDVRHGMNKLDVAMASALPEYNKSVFFSLGWPRATEWDEYRGVANILKFSTEYLLSNFPCILLKDDHKEYRYLYLEYFIDDPKERAEYFEFVQPWRAKNSSPSYADHPLMKKWTMEAKNGTPEEYKKFIREELAIFGSNEIHQHIQKKEPYFEELLVQGKIPLSEATLAE